MKRIVLLLIFILLSIPVQVLATGDICNFAEKTLYQTSFELKEFFEDEIKDSSFSVEGAVINVSPKSTATSLYDVKVRCDTDIIVVVATESSRVEELKTGDRVNFVCKIYKHRRQYYRNSDNIYVKFWCFD